MIWKNFFRELAATTSRLVSVIIIAAVAVLMYVALSGLTYNTEKIMGEYFSAQNVADYWITGVGLTKADCRKLEAISGVTAVQPRVAIEAEARENSDITLLLYAVPEEININVPLITEGEDFAAPRDIMVSDLFAQEQGLDIGDEYEMKIGGNTLKMRVCALVKSPECMYHVNGANPSPDYSVYGFAYIREEAVSQIMGQNVYNQICITAAEGTDDTRLKNQINEMLGTKVVNVLALSDNANAYNLMELIGGIKVIVMVFPMLFFLIAALIMFSTMSRLVENARGAIGTFKALGYSDALILTYYMLYAVLVVIAGYIIGAAPATKFFTTPIIYILFDGIDMPPHRIVTPPDSLIISFMLTAVVCIGTAFYITRRALLESPAQCMRPKPPKKARKILPERIPFIWSRLGFTQKYILRNMFRNKGRMIICIIGIAGCMMLIVTAFAIDDSIQNNLNIMTDTQHNYDVFAAFDAGVSEREYKHIKNLESVDGAQYEMTTGAKLYSDYKQDTSYLRITEDTLSLKLIDVYGNVSAQMPPDGVVIDADIARRLGVAEGDSIRMKFTGDNNYYRADIAGISEGVDGVYAGRTFWRTLGKPFVPTSVYIKANDADALKSRLADYEFVESFGVKKELTDSIRSKVSTMVTVVYLLIIFGGILALVVLYNLGIMSFFEQIRSLATLMVLGFHDNETRKLLLTENFVFTAMGIIIGIPFGVLLAQGIVAAIKMVYIEIHVRVISYIISAVLTFAFAVIVNLMLGKKMRTIDMLGALKSVE